MSSEPQLIAERMLERGRHEAIAGLPGGPEEALAALRFADQLRRSVRQNDELRTAFTDAGVQLTGLNFDENGYVIVGDGCHTNVPGLFAAGDVRDHRCRQPTACSTGAVARRCRKGAYTGKGIADATVGLNQFLREVSIYFAA